MKTRGILGSIITLLGLFLMSGQGLGFVLAGLAVCGIGVKLLPPLKPDSRDDDDWWIFYDFPDDHEP